MVCHSYALVCHPYVTHMYSYVIHMSLVYNRMSPVCHPYVTCIYSYVIRMSPVCSFTMSHYKVPQDMFKNVPFVKTECGNKNASETFAER